MNMSRRTLLKASGSAAGMALIPAAAEASAPIAKKRNVEYSLNMSTIMGQKLGFIKELEVAAQAGYKHCEIWIPTLETYLKSGGTLKEAKKRIDDLGLATLDPIRAKNSLEFKLSAPRTSTKVANDTKAQRAWDTARTTAGAPGC